MEGQPNLIALIIPHDESTRQVFSQPQNEKWCLPPGPGDTAYEKKPTLGPSDTTLQTKPQRKNPPRIELRFDNLPAEGLLFGSDPTCHIHLRTNDSADQNTSKFHFHITYNEHGHLILRDTSKQGTSVKFGAHCDSPRRDFTWLLDLFIGGNAPPRIIVTAPAKDGLVFEIIVAPHSGCPQYPKNIRNFFNQRREAMSAPNRATISAFNRLNLDTHQATRDPSNGHTPGQNAIYFPLGYVASGACGRVERLCDMSTGKQYALKRLAKDNQQKIKEMRNEILIMRKLEHNFTVPLMFDHLGPHPHPLILMPFYRFGNLQTQDDFHRITQDEIRMVFCQSLSALKYLHGKGVTHRDLKPQNILIESRNLESIKIRISDFGFSKYGDNLTSQLGTPPYMAPEFNGDEYSSAIDLWSLGVIAMQYAYCLPQTASPTKIETTAIQAWCNDIIENINYWPLSDMRTMAKWVLKMKPKARLSAAECLDEMRSGTGPNDKTSSQLRIEPTPQSQAYGNNTISKPQQLAEAESPNQQPKPATKQMAILLAAVDDAVAQGLADNMASYFQLPFRDGNVEIRKKDCRINLTGGLAKAGFNRNSIAKLRGRKPRDSNGISKRRNFQWNHIALSTAVICATAINNTELQNLIKTFKKVYRERVKKEDAPPHVYSGIARGSRAFRHSVPPQLILPEPSNPDAGVDHGSRSSTPASIDCPRPVSPVGNGEGNDPDIVEDESLVHDGHISQPSASSVGRQVNKDALNWEGRLRSPLKG